MEFHSLTRHVFYSDCAAFGDRPVLGLVAGADATLAVDCGNSPAHAAWLLDQARALGLPPVRWAVVTHWHWDHVMGGPTLQEAGVHILCGRATAGQLRALEGLEWTTQAMEERIAGGLEIPFCRDTIREEYPREDRQLVPPRPRLVLDGPAELDLGGVTVRLLPHPSDHSMDSLLVHIPEDRVVFLGDSIYLNMYVSPWHYTGEKLLPLLDTLEGLDADWYLPAHHDKMLDRKAFLEFSAWQRLLCRLAGSDTTAEAPAERLAGNLGRAPSPQELEELMAFVRGNLVKTR
jgi:glyoxylase-like metal-dependent hydrolase (beta-lactamase superfamily II)